MVNALRFFKVAQLPQSPLPNSAYFVLREDDTFDFHITDDQQVRTVELTIASNVPGDTSTRSLRIGSGDGGRQEVL